MPDSPLSIGFGVKFNEAIAQAEKRKVVLPNEYYGKLQGVARQQAFSVAGLTSLDQLQQVKDSLDKAIDDGESFGNWRKKILEKGTLNLPEYRLDNIFRTNIQGSYMAGHWDAFMVTKDTLPYAMYDAINDSRVRPSHLALDGIIRRLDDSFWSVHSPPNGYRCRCSMISLSAVEAESRSGVDQGLNKKPILPDGEPARPDTGWEYNPNDRMGGVNAAIESRKETASPKLVKELEDVIKINTLLINNDALQLDLNNNDDVKSDNIYQMTNYDYEIAKGGGRHNGFFKQWSKQTRVKIEKSIKSLSDQINYHNEKIANPNNYIDRIVSDYELKYLVSTYWPKEIRNFEQQINILEGILEEIHHVKK